MPNYKLANLLGDDVLAIIFDYLEDLIYWDRTTKLKQVCNLELEDKWKRQEIKLVDPFDKCCYVYVSLHCPQWYNKKYAVIETIYKVPVETFLNEMITMNKLEYELTYVYASGP